MKYLKKQSCQVWEYIPSEKAWRLIDTFGEDWKDQENLDEMMFHALRFYCPFVHQDWGFHPQRINEKYIDI
jgi:hypothetical protein